MHKKTHLHILNCVQYSCSINHTSKKPFIPQKMLQRCTNYENTLFLLEGRILKIDARGSPRMN
jgi:hypothetical protein